MSNHYDQIILDDDRCESGCIDFGGFTQEELDKMWAVIRETFSGPDPKEESNA